MHAFNLAHPGLDLKWGHVTRPDGWAPVHNGGSTPFSVPCVSATAVEAAEGQGSRALWSWYLLTSPWIDHMIKTEKCVVWRLTARYKHPFLLILIIAVAIAALAWYQSQSITLFVLTQQSCCTGRVASGWLWVGASSLGSSVQMDIIFLSPEPNYLSGYIYTSV